MKTSIRHHARTVAEALIWYHFLPHYSENGESWYQIFDASGAERIAFLLDDLVDRLRHSREGLEPASRRLASIHDSILALGRSVPASIRGVLEEGYRGALAYWYFRGGDLDAADAELSRALAAVDETLRSDRALLTFSLKNLQLLTNCARIARRQHDWPRMIALLERCEQMLAGRDPLHLGDGLPIYLADICSFYRRVEPATEVDIRALEILVHSESLAAGFHRAIASVWASFHVANDY
jgi:hypothetical protein